MTGGRLKRLKNFVGSETFLFTYGDGVSNVNLKKLINQHKKTKKLVTLTAVRPPARFGALKINNENVINFREKSKLDEGWINGGYFTIEPKFLNYIKSDKTFLEREPLELITKRLLGAYKHKGFWQCVDTKRDKDLLEEYLKKKIMKRGNVLLVGGTGFIGYHLALRLIKLGFKVFSLSRKKPKKKRQIKNLKYIYSDFINYSVLKKIKNNFDYVINLGGNVNHREINKTYNSHYVAVKNLVKISKKKKLRDLFKLEVV